MSKDDTCSLYQAAEIGSTAGLSLGLPLERRGKQGQEPSFLFHMNTGHLLVSLGNCLASVLFVPY